MAFTLKDFADALTGFHPILEAATHELLELQCEVVEAEAKRVIGTYDYGWPQLAESTQKDRVNKGFSANEPLLRTGGLRDSIQHEIRDGVGYVFSNSPIARYQELGTERIPPRSFLGGASRAMEDRCHEIAGMGTASLLWSAMTRQPGRSLRRFLYPVEAMNEEGVRVVR
jgi:hypothetical protein